MLPLLKLMFCQSMAATSADMDQTEWLNSFWHIFGLCCVRLHSVGIAEHNVLAVAFCQVSIVLGVAALGNRSGAVTVCIHWRRHDCIVRSTILYWHQPYIILAMPFALVSVYCLLPQRSLFRIKYAWVQGRRATSKVTATSGGRLTNRYAWVPGRPTRRACLGVKLPLRVLPCKHYPEEVTE